jgi:hypothetical protein
VFVRLIDWGRFTTFSLGSGDYLGKTVQVVPHVCNEIQDWVERVAAVPVDGQAARPDVCVIELGGTVGESSHVQTMKPNSPYTLLRPLAVPYF